MDINSALPSVYLPSLRPPPSTSLLLTLLTRLSAIYAPQNITVDLTTSLKLAPLSSDTLVEDDSFEEEFVRGWLGRVVTLASRELGKGGEEEWEEVMDGAAGLLASLSGHCAAGSTTRTFLLPSPPPPYAPPSTPPISLTIRDTTLLSNTTGFRTWGSAPLLSRLICSSPSTFLPSFFSSVSSTTPHPSLRVLELGSGTGLVGLTFARLLSLLPTIGPSTEVHLTDYEPATLSNLAHNLSINFPPSSTSSAGPKISISPLDWSSYLPTALSTPPKARYDIILGADLIYEPQHVNLLLHTVSSLLRFPATSLDDADPAFHLVLPLRSTHTVENDEFMLMFEGDGKKEGRVEEDEEGRRWRLRLKERREVDGEDGFGGGRGGRKERGKVERYWVCRIGWEKVE